jgi:hypothetical protein
MRRVLQAQTAAALLACCALLLGCSAAPPRVADHDTQDSRGSNDSPQASAVIYVVRRSWHVDIGFAAAELQPPLAALREQLPGAGVLLVT